MSPYETLQRGCCVDYNNSEEPCAQWLQRLTNAFPWHARINPEPSGVWQYRPGTSLIQHLIGARMPLLPLPLKGLEGAMRLLSK